MTPAVSTCKPLITLQEGCTVCAECADRGAVRTFYAVRRGSTQAGAVRGASASGPVDDGQRLRSVWTEYISAACES
jgi:hypothetical protein